MTNNYLSATAASYSASSAAAINDSSFDEEEVSSDLVDHSGDEDDNKILTHKEANVNDDDDDDINLERIFSRCPGHPVRAIRTAEMEDCRFRKLFGASIGVILHVWHAMEEGGLLPDKSPPKHLLWTLYFLKVYPREVAGCSAFDGGGGGSNDPKKL
jgi:hypothetical protein